MRRGVAVRRPESSQLHGFEHGRRRIFLLAGSQGSLWTRAHPLGERIVSPPSSLKISEPSLASVSLRTADGLIVDGPRFVSRKKLLQQPAKRFEWASRGTPNASGNRNSLQNSDAVLGGVPLGRAGVTKSVQCSASGPSTARQTPTAANCGRPLGRRRGGTREWRTVTSTPRTARRAQRPARERSC